MRFFRRSAALLLLFVACFPTAPCACPPVLGIATVTGSVTRSDRSPTANVALQLAAHPLTCTSSDNFLVDRSETVTNEAGTYEYRLSILGLDDRPGCVRVTVLSPNADTIATATAPVRFVPSYGTRQSPETVRLDLQLP